MHGFTYAFQNNDVIVKYFNDGFSSMEIAEILNNVHDFQTTFFSLKRWLKDKSLKEVLLQLFNLYIIDIGQVVQEELNGQGACFKLGTSCKTDRTDLIDWMSFPPPNLVEKISPNTKPSAQIFKAFYQHGNPEKTMFYTMRKREQFMQPSKTFKKIIRSMLSILIIQHFTAEKAVLTLPRKSKN